ESDGERKIIPSGETWHQDPPAEAAAPAPVPVEAAAPERRSRAPEAQAGLPRSAFLDAASLLAETPEGLHLLQGDAWLLYRRTPGPEERYLAVFRRAVRAPPQAWFIAPVGSALAVATRTEYLYFFDEAGARTGVRVGALSGHQVYHGGGKIWVVNAAGELHEIDRRFRVVRTEKVLTASLWEGVVLDGSKPVLALPDVGPRLILVDLQTGTARARALPSPAKGAPRSTGKGLFIPGPDLSLDPGI
ncbi:MAG: hypothetical protein J0L75_20780, partial [Spirochaetes bacterium]|nr:hypothetical protein [Spirochaetota bacterium]